MIVLLSLALSAEVHLVRDGETVESIAAELGDPALAPVIRGENGLAAGSQPDVGVLLRLPPLPGHVDHDAAVLSVSGEATATVPSMGDLPLTVGFAIPAGSTACTGSDGFLTLRLAVDPTTGLHDDVNLLPSTCVRIVAASSRATERSSAVEVASGGIEVRASDGGPGAFAVLTEAGATSGRGGFRVAVEPATAERKLATRTEALYAPVAVIGAGVEVPMRAGQGSRTRVGEAPSDPVDLLPPGSLVSPGDGAPLRRPTFTWTPVQTALGYRIQLSTSSDFSQLVYVEDVPTPRHLPESLFLPYRVPGLWWRVSSFDLTGFEGVPSAPRRLAIPDGFGP